MYFHESYFMYAHKENGRVNFYSSLNIPILLNLPALASWGLTCPSSMGQTLFSQQTNEKHTNKPIFREYIYIE